MRGKNRGRDGISTRHVPDLDMLLLLEEIRQHGFIDGYTAKHDFEEQEGSLTPEDQYPGLLARVQCVLASFVARLERLDVNEEVMSFVHLYTRFWIMRGQQQGGYAAPDVEQKVRLRVFHSASHLDWETVQSALDLCLILPRGLISLLADTAFKDLSWSVGDVHYHITLCAPQGLDGLHSGRKEGDGSE